MQKGWQVFDTYESYDIITCNMYDGNLLATLQQSIRQDKKVLG